MTDEDQGFQLEVRRAGLAELLKTYRAELQKAKVSAERLMRHIPRGLHMYDEPAHIFRAMQGPGHD